MPVRKSSRHTRPSRRHRRRPLATIGLGATVFAVTATMSLASAAAAGAAPTGCGGYTAVVACYDLNDADTTMRDSSDPASDVANVTGPKSGGGVTNVQQNGAYAEYFFSGWVGHTSTASATLGELNPNESIPARFGEAVVDKRGVTTGETFNPGTGPWRIATRVRPYTVAVKGQSNPELPNPSSCQGCPQAKPSYNLVQKGRNGSPSAGGFYKIEIMGYSGGRAGQQYVKGSVHCELEDADGTALGAFTGAVRNAADNVVLNDSSHSYDIDCVRSGNGLTLTVSERDASGTLLASQTVRGALLQKGTDGVLGDVRPENGSGATRFSPLFSIGKKPDSTHIEDAFAGWVDYVVLATL